MSATKEQKLRTRANALRTLVDRYGVHKPDFVPAPLAQPPAAGVNAERDRLAGPGQPYGPQVPTEQLTPPAGAPHRAPYPLQPPGDPDPWRNRHKPNWSLLRSC